MNKFEFTIESTAQKAIDTFGKEAQVDKAIEEMAELTKALLKERRFGGSVQDVIEETADVLIMMCQMILIFDAKTQVDDVIHSKIERLKNRLKETEND